MSLRTPLEDWRYKRFLKKGVPQPLNTLPAIQEWAYWKLVKPISKHNRHHKQHHMLVLKRQCGDIWQGVTNNEVMDLWRFVLPELDTRYHYVKINFKVMRSVGGYVHLHVLILKDRYK